MFHRVLMDNMRPIGYPKEVELIAEDFGAMRKLEICPGSQYVAEQAISDAAVFLRLDVYGGMHARVAGVCTAQLQM